MKPVRCPGKKGGFPNVGHSHQDHHKTSQSKAQSPVGRASVAEEIQIELERLEPYALFYRLPN